MDGQRVEVESSSRRHSPHDRGRVLAGGDLAKVLEYCSKHAGNSAAGEAELKAWDTEYVSIAANVLYERLLAQLMRQDVEQCKTFSCKRDRHLSGSRRFSSLPALADRRVVSCSKVDSLWQLVMFLDGEQHCISNLFLTVGVIFGMQPKLYLC
ncbi:uncharacterized protein LOC120105484 isoform X2 [Phoenix dactylifera]|uniref:Uncharacterized protein LOC120105484 isoform X2 n=1 Tax=Phoenix dactylifera TaxID=42345 RepID=A0A8B8ZR11_PHODC|nr:uncharacterized protein LOC120105484 isoform X2 [Phoenix dactylifera]